MSGTISSEIQEKATAASSWISQLVDEYGGHVTAKFDNNGIVLTVQVRNHPCPPHQFGWHTGGPLDTLSQALLYIKFQQHIVWDLAARIGNPDDPDNCQCVDCYRDRARKIGIEAAV